MISPIVLRLLAQIPRTDKCMFTFQRGKYCPSCKRDKYLRLFLNMMNGNGMGEKCRAALESEIKAERQNQSVQAP